MKNLDRNSVIGAISVITLFFGCSINSVGQCAFVDYPEVTAGCRATSGYITISCLGQSGGNILWNNSSNTCAGVDSETTTRMFVCVDQTACVSKPTQVTAECRHTQFGGADGLDPNPPIELALGVMTPSNSCKPRRRVLDPICEACQTNNPSPPANGGGPINFGNGNVWISQHDYSNPTQGGVLSVDRTWNSLLFLTYGMFGAGWTSNLEQQLTIVDPNTIYYVAPEGGLWIFSYQNAAWTLTSPVNRHATLTFDSSTTHYTLTLKDGTVETFQNNGQLSKITDRNGNSTMLTYNSQNQLIQVTDAKGRSLFFTYTGVHTGSVGIGDGGGAVVSTISDNSVAASQSSAWGGAVVSTVSDDSGTIATYTYGDAGFLTQVKYANNTIHYNYDKYGLFITSVTDQNGALLEAHTYDLTGRGLSSVRANGADAITVSYPSPNVATVTDSKGNVSTYKFTVIAGRYYLISSTGPGCSSCGTRGNNSFAYDGDGNLLYATDALGRITSYTYDASDNLTSKSAGAQSQ